MISKIEGTIFAGFVFRRAEMDEYIADIDIEKQDEETIEVRVLWTDEVSGSLAAYSNYPQVVKALDALTDLGFAVENPLTIVEIRRKIYGTNTPFFALETGTDMDNPDATPEGCRYAGYVIRREDESESPFLSERFDQIMVNRALSELTDGEELDIPPLSDDEEEPEAEPELWVQSPGDAAFFTPQIVELVLGKIYEADPFFLAAGYEIRETNNTYACYGPVMTVGPNDIGLN